MSNNLLAGIKHFKNGICTRNIGIFAPIMQKATDPIQQLFIEKLREYKLKSKDGKLVEPSPDIERELKSELEKVTKQYGGADGEDMTKFPTFKWTEPVLDPIDTVVAQK